MERTGRLSTAEKHLGWHLSTAEELVAQFERLPSAEERMERYKTFAANSKELVGRSGAPESANQRVGSLIAPAVMAASRIQPEQRAIVAAMPECIEHNRLAKLQQPHLDAQDELIKKVLSTPALTPKGKLEKFFVLLNFHYARRLARG